MAAQADTLNDNRTDSEQINQTIDTCLKTQDRSEACIGQATETCRKQDLGAANPIQQMAWCAGAEQTVWEGRMKSDIAAITQLVPKGPAFRAFMVQQRVWQAYAHDAFPYDRISTTFPWGYWGQSGVMPIVATRALQVHEIRVTIKECFAEESDFRPQPLCYDITKAP